MQIRNKLDYEAHFYDALKVYISLNEGGGGILVVLNTGGGGGSGRPESP